MTAVPQPAQDAEVSVKRPSFWVLADDLQAYTETLGMLDAQLAEPLPDDERALIATDRAEVQEAIERIGADLVAKADNLAGVIRRMKVDREFLREEAHRIAAKRDAIERAEKWLKDYTRDTMVANGWKNLKTPLNTISVRGNGGLKPLDIDTDKLPAKYKTFDVRIPGDGFDAAEFAFLYPGYKVLDAVPDNGKIRKALDEPCPTCGGEIFPPPKVCADCGGAGFTPIPGVKVLDRGQHIELR